MVAWLIGVMILVWIHMIGIVDHERCCILSMGLGVGDDYFDLGSGMCRDITKCCW